MNADHDEAVEFAKISKRENRVYVGNLSYDVKYRDLIEFMRGGGWGNLRLVFGFFRSRSCGSCCCLTGVMASFLTRASACRVFCR